MLDFTFNVSADTRKLEKQMADLAAKLEEIKATIEAEKAEVGAEIAALGAKIDELKAACEAGHVEKEQFAAALDEIKSGVEGIFTKAVEPTPDPEPAPVEPPVGE